MNKDLIYRFFAGETSERENGLLQKWVESDPANLEEFNKTHEMYLLSIFSSDILSKNEETAPVKPKRRRTFLYASVCAAVALIACLLTYTLSMKSVNELIDNSTLISQSMPDQRSKVTLPDGTVVELNAGSSIEYPAIFNKKQRRVKIEGEAILDVAHNARQPFIVETFAYDIKVLGTKFDVIADKGKNEFSAALFEGKIALLNKTDNTVCANLNPKDMIYAENGKLKTRKITEGIDDYEWNKGIVTLSGIPFDQVVKRLERCYGIHIVIDRENLPNIQYNYLKVRISNGIEYALSVLKKGSDFDYRYDDNTDTYHIF